MSTILLVEDNEMNRDMLTRRLEKHGHTVHVAVDGVDGCDMAGTVSPDIILMDMSLPRMDGWEATRKLKVDDETQHIPIIGLSAHAMSSDREKAMASGCDDYDTKPVDIKRLLGKIESIIS